MTQQDGITTRESWREIEGVLFVGHGQVSRQTEEVSRESLMLTELDGNVFYIAKPQQNDLPVPFKLTLHSDHHAKFENASHDFPKVIEYELDANGKLAVRVSDGADNEFRLEFTTDMTTDPRKAALSPDVWRQEQRIIDLHQHIESRPERIDRAIAILDRVGVGIGFNLGSGTVTAPEGDQSAFERATALTDSAAPGRFMHHMLLDYTNWDAADWSEQAVAQIEKGHRLGAAGLKEFKRLGLMLKDQQGQLLKIDDPKLDPVWKRCGELDMPVSIHVGDPKAFWLPYDESNERWTELKDHRSWWFGDPEVHPPRMELLEALSRVIERHPETTFVCVHFANNPEELEWVDQALGRLPNMFADLAARIPEIGRHDPAKVRELFMTHQDRILFATDFMVYDKLILGSGGDAEQPTDDDAVTFFMKCYRWLETADRDWPHMTPIQGDWLISSIDLPPEVSRKIYFDNAQRLFARSMPLPVLRASRIEDDFAVDGRLDQVAWRNARPQRLEYQSLDAQSRPELSTPVRALWSDRYLYLAYECPYTELSTFQPIQAEERMGLWENDVVEAFIGSEPGNVGKYVEMEWSPSGEVLDVKIDLPEKDFVWTASVESAVTVDELLKVWRIEARIPLQSLAEQQPTLGTRWKLNLYRHDRANGGFLAMSPTLRGSFHTPERFGWLEFAGEATELE